VSYNRFTINVQQNSLNLTSDNPEILIIWHLRGAVPRPEALLLYQKKLLSETGNLSDTLEKSSKIVCTSTVVVSPDSLSHTASASSAMKIPENTEEGPCVPEPADERDNQMEYCSD
jgi:hypothetical protein